MTQNITIEDWWNDLLQKYRGFMGAGYDLQEHLDKTIKECGEQERAEIIDFLTKKATQKGDDFGIALGVLKNHCSPDNLELIFKKAKTLDLTDNDIIYYLRVLGKQGKSEHKGLLEDFLLSPKINPNHSFVQWSTYPNFPDLFARAYIKYLTETDYNEWKESAIVQAFMDEPKALEILQKNLEKENMTIWRQLKSNLKKELSKDIWEKQAKENINKIILRPTMAIPNKGLVAKLKGWFS